MRQHTDPAQRDAGREQMRWIMALWRQARVAAALSLVLPLLNGALLVAQAYLLSEILHDAIVGGAERSALLRPIALAASIMALRASLSFVADQAGTRAAEAVKHAAREILFRRLMESNPTWTARRSSGALASAVVDQIETLEGFIARYLPATVTAAVLPLAFAVATLPVDVVIGLLFLVTAPLIPIFMALVGWGAEAASRHHVQAFARLSGLFSDRLRGILTLKLFGRAEAEAVTIEQASDEVRTRTLGIMRIAFLSSAVLEFFAALGVAGVALYVGLTYLGLIDFRSSPLTLQAGLFCLLMAPEVYWPLRQMALHYHDRSSAKAATAEIAELFEGLPDTQEPPPLSLARERAERSMGIVANHLTLRTPDGQRTVLSNEMLHLRPGEHLAVVGESGIGKSTLLEALAGLREYDGEIWLGQKRLPDIPELALRSDLALLTQRPHLFHGTIADNIRLGDPEATSAQVRRAATLACVTDFSDNMPDGLETAIGDGGEGLSGGEAHRVALARIFLRDPAIILLDEPTAHLDSDTEDRVLGGILNFAADRTLIVATHSPKVSAGMDGVVRMAGQAFIPAPRPRPAIRAAAFQQGAA